MLIGFKGLYGQLELYEDKIVLKRKGFRAKLNNSFTDMEEITYVGDISKINFKKGGFFTKGFIHIVSSGFSLGEQRLVFKAKQNNEAISFIKQIEKLRNENNRLGDMSRNKEIDELAKDGKVKEGLINGLSSMFSFIKGFSIFILALGAIGLVFSSSPQEGEIKDTSTALSSSTELKGEKKLESAKVENRLDISHLNYEIVGIDDGSLGDIKRYSIRVVVDGNPNINELRELSNKITESQKDTLPFNAISIYFYDSIYYANGLSSLGIVDYAPGGNWGNASDVKKGDYSESKYSYSLKEKNWNNKPSDDEALIYAKWDVWENAFFEHIYDNDLEDSQEDLMEEFKVEFIKDQNISMEYFENTIIKVLTWLHNDLS